MISRVIEAKPEDMRAFLEEAAGISRYKERRKETEARIAHTRENLERLKDLRDEVDKQIRHLQRQAATARRYQALKKHERQLTAELLALRLREIDSGAEGSDRPCANANCRCRRRSPNSAPPRPPSRRSALPARAVRARERACRAATTRSARRSAAPSSRSRTRASCASGSATNWRRRATTLAELQLHIDARRARRSRSCVPRSSELGPDARAGAGARRRAQRGLAAAEQRAADWQQRWEDFNREQGAAHQTTQVERARIEQLENQLRRLAAQPDRLAVEREALDGAERRRCSAQLDREGSCARSSADELRAR